MKVWTIGVVLLFSLLVMGMVQFDPTTSLKAEQSDTVSHLPVRQLLFDGYTGKLWVSYTPTKHTRSDLKQIAAAGFTGVVVPAHSLQFVKAEAKGLNLQVSAHKREVRVTAADFWHTLIRANHRYLTEGIREIEFDSWAELKAGIETNPHMSVKLNGDMLVFHNDTPAPKYDHYTVFVSTNANQLMPLIDLAPGTDALDMSHFALPTGNYGLVVKMVGKPLVRNALSNVVMYQRK